MSTIQQNIIIFISTCFKLGFLTKFPGTLGSIVAMIFVPFVVLCDDFVVIIILTGLFFLGLWASDRYSIKNDDPSEVIIDEFVGMLFTCYIVQLFVVFDVFLALLSFVSFRLFDIIKPWPISFFDKRVKGGFGIMLDDVVASVFASVVTVLFVGGVYEVSVGITKFT